MSCLRSRRIVAVLLFIFTAAVFSPALFCNYVAFDDPSYVAENIHVLSGLSLENVRWAFSVHNGFWSPVLWISYMFDSSLLTPVPWAFHLTNVLLHSLNAALLFLLLSRITGKSWLSLATATLWVLHPLRVESVVWITERKDVLSAFLMFLALYAYICFVQRRGAVRYLAVFFFMAAGLMVKPVLVTLPVLMLLLDYWPLNRFTGHWAHLVTEKIPLFVCAMVFTVTGWLAHRGAISSLETYSFAERTGIALHNYIFYLGKTLWPFGLAAPYPMMVPSFPCALTAAATLTVITLTALLLFRRAPFIFIGWFWFAIALAPVCGFIQIGNTTTADRFTYLPSIGLTVALVWGIAAVRRISFKKELLPIVAAGLILMTVRQIAFWYDSDTLFRRALAVTERNPVAHAHYGGWLVEEGRLDEAEPHLLLAVKLFPGYSPAVNNLGLLFFRSGDVERALVCFEAACANPRHSEQAEINLESCRRFIQKKEQ